MSGIAQKVEQKCARVEACLPHLLLLLRRIAREVLPGTALSTFSLTAWSPFFFDSFSNVTTAARAALLCRSAEIDVPEADSGDLPLMILGFLPSRNRLSKYYNSLGSCVSLA